MWTKPEQVMENFVERPFLLPPTLSDSAIPGVYRTPLQRSADRLVLVGHGGGSDSANKQSGYIVSIAGLLAERGIASLSIDGPGHGERATFHFEGHPGELDRAWASGGGTEGVVADWRAGLDFIEAEHGVRPTGWWGISMGTMMGVPVIAADTRIRCAVLGLMGVWGSIGPELERRAPEVTCPLRFLVQWDDATIPRATCFELFDRLGSTRKTLHANPGAHAEIPAFEFEATADYLARYLK
ncbi:MAG: alpha/beta hydrolase family protein [Ilumatobacteraceae bacterium]